MGAKLSRSDPVGKTKLIKSRKANQLVQSLISAESVLGGESSWVLVTWKAYTIEGFDPGSE